jgi:hypothetical protein
MNTDSLCGKMIQIGRMSESRPCMRLVHHTGSHTPDLTGMMFGNLQVIEVGKPYIIPSTKAQVCTWNCLNIAQNIHITKSGTKLIDGSMTGRCAPAGAGCLLATGYRLVSHQGKQVFEHRVVMAQIIGRELRADETVHHGPKGRGCNDPDNLSVRLIGKHPAGHSEQELADWLQSLGWKVTPPERIQP